MFKKRYIAIVGLAGLVTMCYWPADLSGCAQFQDTYIPRTHLLQPASHPAISSSSYDKPSSMGIWLDINSDRQFISLYGKYARGGDGFHSEAVEAYATYGSEGLVPEPYAEGYYRQHYSYHEGQRTRDWYLVNAPQPPNSSEKKWVVASCSEAREGSASCTYWNQTHNINYETRVRKHQFAKLDDLHQAISKQFDEWSVCKN
ncbi:hypothetical protein [Pseudoalteromonas sp. T1lg23B]|uniref:hypothetical protein n=1 Tax=Pseudoalteromonas sp. T1lg23B TaxID=2077097 RepID=UPI000CF6676B|nr:hypothetical protein [Pseudoalteromonas sp. T1lg23B]